MKTLWLSACILAACGSSFAKEVIDLGSLKIEGAARGPEIQFIDSMRVSGDTAGRLISGQLQRLEAELLKSDLIEEAPAVRKGGKAK